MIATTLSSKHKFIKEKERSRDKSLAFLSGLFLSVYYILPQYTGISVGFDLTPQRMMVIVMCLYLMEKRERIQEFYKGVVAVKGVSWLIIFMGVLAYTAVYRRHPGTFLYSFFEFVGLFIVVYIINESYGIKKTIRFLNVLGFILCMLGIVEYVMKVSPFSYLETLPGMYTGRFFRSGNYRIMGPANHSLAYGLILVTMVPFCCLDLEDETIDIFARPVFFVLIALNILLTGSRSTLAVFLVELFVLYIFSTKEKRKKTLLVGVVMIVLLVVVVLGTWGSSLSKYIMLQVTSVIDEVLGTDLSVKFGADTSRLENSSYYRKVLPKIFKCPFLNPLIGRGSQASFHWYVDGIAINSVDNYYASMYIKYAYPGLISYCLFMLTNIVTALHDSIKMKKGIALAAVVAMTMYFVNLWWLDALMTVKYVYIPFAIYVSYCMAQVKDLKNDAERKSKYIR